MRCPKCGRYTKKNTKCLKCTDSVVGIVGDTHFPYSKKGYLEFCYNTFIKEGVTEVVHIGDIVDNHNWSRWATEPDADGGLTEFEKSYKDVQRFNQMFSVKWPITLILGNHDRIVERHISKFGLPRMLLKAFQELYDVPEWDVRTLKIIDGVEYRHGINCTATLLTAQRLRRSCVFGHSHSKADIQTHANFEDLVFGMHVGCGIDDKALAFRYGKESTLKSVISCATVKNGKHPQLHYMEL